MNEVINKLMVKDHIDIISLSIENKSYSGKHHIHNVNGTVTIDSGHSDNATSKYHNDVAVVEFIYGYYGFIVGVLNAVVDFYSNENNLQTHLIILTQREKNVDDFFQAYEKFLITYLDDLQISYSLEPILLGNASINLNNFTYLFQDKPYLASKNVYPKIKKYLSSNVSNKKVFISRRFAARETSELEKRSANLEELENIFTELGFEIVYAEQFENFIDQINYFNSVAVLAGVTGAGMSNMIFMNPASKVIQLLNPVSVDHGNYDGSRTLMKELHLIYDTMAFFKNHKSLLIPNPFDPNDLRNDKDTLNLIKEFSK